MEHLPTVTSQIQLILLAVAIACLLSILSIVGMLWQLRGPVNAIIEGYLASDEGKAAIAAGVREYMTRAEGVIFMEGVINGKVRREIAEHDRQQAAHYDKFALFAKREDLNKGLDSLRAEMAGQVSQAALVRAEIVSALKGIGEGIEKAAEKAADRAGGKRA